MAMTRSLRRRLLALVAALTIAAIAVALLRPAPPATQQALTGRTMGTAYRIKYRPTPGAPAPAELQAEVDRLLAEINRSMSTYDPDSELSRFNRARTTDWVAISPALHTVLQAALLVGAQSEGAFDVTVGPLVNLWGFGPEPRNARIPAAADLTAARQRVGHDTLELRDAPPALRKTRADVHVDLSAIAKGYGVDRVSELLDARGLAHHLVEIGGEVRARGRNAWGERWRVAVERPLSTGRSLGPVLALDGAALATSGGYRNFFTIGGRRYAHIIDPVSGWPVRNRAASVSVVADSCMLADAWATALQVLGPERGMATAERLDLAVLFIVEHEDRFEERASRALQAYREAASP